jgi:hypothetical protein
MNITYNTRINLIDYVNDDTLGQVAQRLRWQIVGAADTGETQITYGECALSTPDPANFTPWEQLTEAQAITWLETAVGFEELEARKQTIAAALRDQLFPLAPVAPPWAD